MPCLSLRSSATFAAPALVTLALLGGCAGQPSTPSHDGSFYRSERPAITLDYASELVRVGHTGGHFGPHGWHSFAAPDSPGQRLITLQLPDSSDVSRAQWRLGISRDSMAVYQCLAPPESASSEGTGIARLAGHRFVTFETSEADMNHYRHVHGYRSVIDGTCYAIDLVVEGVNGTVYDPPRQPPFSRDRAFERLQQINGDLQLDER
ncbi:hypothetical protein C7446_2614 [Kushneria sinocarnis]|uniref:Uncharacterized protein n=1 Tax=Kushneria sinocarnis TaxID=595502 RepID=A0A420WUU5_9GAMM|nr:hypothetical protein [Kushneria sinocarnis]RKQ97192.1 hypothetical protein C7446_2614 [Kushneria sinocarnis]